MNLVKRAGVYRELAILTAMLILTALLSFPARAEEAESLFTFYICQRNDKQKSKQWKI